jgi:hypothetical protein
MYHHGLAFWISSVSAGPQFAPFCLGFPGIDIGLDGLPTTILSS